MLHGQAIPTATSREPAYNPGPSLPVIDGNFQYSVTASELIQRGGIGNYSEPSLSGNLEYLSKSAVRPFSIFYTGGILYSTYKGLGVQTFQNLTVSQGLVAGPWNLGVSDSVSYLPQTPTTGLSGIPGQGNQGVLPPPNPTVPVQSILTTNARRLSNSISGNIERRLNGRTSLTGDADYGILRFVDGNGVDSTQIGSQVAINRKLNARSGISLNGQYSVYSFSGGTTFTTRGLNLDYSRILSKSLTMQVSAGPQWISSFSGKALGTGTNQQVSVPSRLNAAANASVSYTHRFTQAGLSYSRGVNSGSGVQTGGIADSVSGSLNQSFGRDWSAGVSATFTNTGGVATVGTTRSVYGGAQVSRRISRSFSSYASFTAQHQNLNSALTNPYLLNGTTQTYAIGITYSPGAVRLGQF